MNIEIPDIWEDRFCNECLRGQEEVKVITVGSNCIALCKGCREKLRRMINEDIYSICGVHGKLFNNEQHSATAAQMQIDVFQKKLADKLK